MYPVSKPNVSFNTLAMGAKQLVVQDALLTMRSSAVKMSSLTPSTTVFKSPLAGAEMMTLPAPAVKCADAFSASANTPVDSTTRSTWLAPHGKSAGLRSAVI